MKKDEIKKLNNSQGEDFTVKIVDVFEYEGVKYAEVQPVGFNGFNREVPITMLK